MDKMDAWSVFLSTGNVLDYLRYSSMKDSMDYFVEKDDDKKEEQEEKNRFS